MIKTLQIENYQSHEKTELKLSPGINVIIGPTDSGKTVVLRALNWLINNRPLGDNFKCDKNEDSEIRVFLSNEEWYMSRIKDYEKDFNGYSLIHSRDGNKKYDFDKIKTEVPEKIKKALNLSSVNYQSQLSKHFLITESPGEVGRVINECTRMVDIDRVMRWFEERLRKNREQEKFTAKDLETKKEEIKQYEGIEAIGERINKILELEKLMPPIMARIERLSNLLARLNKLSEDKKEIDNWISVEKQVKDLSKAIDDLECDKEELSRINFGISELNKKQSVYNRLNEELEGIVERKGKMMDNFVKELLQQGYCPYCRGKIDKDKAELLLRGKKE